MSYKLATFAGGCFWCMVKPFETWPGIIQVVSGYTGGHKVNPTYEEVCTGTTGHIEAVEITYDENIIPFEKIVEIFWQQIDPTDAGGQFYDRGSTYQTAIFYHDEEQRRLAETSKRNLEERRIFSDPIVTKILPATPFYQAEAYHQQYYKKNPVRYEAYQEGSGRKKFIETYWSK